MRHAQIERLRALKKRIGIAWRSQEGLEGLVGHPVDVGAVLVDVEELVNILLMDREGHDGASTRRRASVNEITGSIGPPAVGEDAADTYDGKTPAMTEEEWKSNEWHTNLNSAAKHVMAASCLHGQPFGFTWEDIDMLKMSARTVLGAMEHRALLSMADRIEALLPPEEK